LFFTLAEDAQEIDLASSVTSEIVINGTYGSFSPHQLVDTKNSTHLQLLHCADEEFMSVSKQVEAATIQSPSVTDECQIHAVASPPLEAAVMHIPREFTLCTVLDSAS
jgi:hypothetical protein